ncbi:MAG: hypothetical protein MRY83_00955 [Flavobacteriales bacterium]|nr:hypothetical protein [Flavobacteriales bacterium]
MNKDLQDNEFDELFRNKLSGDEVNVPDGLWAGIDSSTSAAGGSSSGAGVNGASVGGKLALGKGLAIFISSAIIVGSVLSYIFVFQNEPTQENNLVTEEVIESESEPKNNPQKVPSTAHDFAQENEPHSMDQKTPEDKYTTVQKKEEKSVGDERIDSSENDKEINQSHLKEVENQNANNITKPNKANSRNSKPPKDLNVAAAKSVVTPQKAEASPKNEQTNDISAPQDAQELTNGDLSEATDAQPQEMDQIQRDLDAIDLEEKAEDLNAQDIPNDDLKNAKANNKTDAELNEKNQIVNDLSESNMNPEVTENIVSETLPKANTTESEPVSNMNEPKPTSPDLSDKSDQQMGEKDDELAMNSEVDVVVNETPSAEVPDDPENPNQEKNKKNKKNPLLDTNPLSDPNNIEQSSAEFLSRISLEAFGGINHNGQQLSANDPDIDPQFFKDHETSAFTWSYGGNVKFEVNDNWLIGVGANINFWERSFAAEDYEVNVLYFEDEIEFTTSQGDVITSYEPIEGTIEDYVFEDFDDDEDIPWDYEFEMPVDVDLFYSFKYVTIPLSITYQQKLKAVNFGLGASIYGRFLMDSNFEGTISTEFESNTFDDLETLEIEDQLYGLSLFATAEMPVGKKLSVFLRPRFAMDIKSATYMSVVNNRRTNFGAQAGLRFRLK